MKSTLYMKQEYTRVARRAALDEVTAQRDQAIAERDMDRATRDASCAHALMTVLNSPCHRKLSKSL